MPEELPMKKFPMRCGECHSESVYLDLVEYKNVKFLTLHCRQCGEIYFSGLSDEFMHCLLNPPAIAPEDLPQDPSAWRSFAKAFRQGLKEIQLAGYTLEDGHLILNGCFEHCGVPVEVTVRAPAKALLANMLKMAKITKSLGEDEKPSAAISESAAQCLQCVQCPRCSSTNVEFREGPPHWFCNQCYEIWPA